MTIDTIVKGLEMKPTSGFDPCCPCITDFVMELCLYYRTTVADGPQTIRFHA